MLERQLSEKEYLVGDYSLADVAFAPTVLQLEKLEIKLEPSMANVRAWITRLSERPSMRKALAA